MAAAYRIFPSTTRIVNSLQSIRYAFPSINNITTEIGTEQKNNDLIIK